MKGEARFSLGFMKPSASLAVRQRPVVRTPPARAARWDSPIRKRALATRYVTSQMGTSLTGDPRDVALRDAIYAACK